MPELKWWIFITSIRRFISELDKDATATVVATETWRDDSKKHATVETFSFVLRKRDEGSGIVIILLDVGLSVWTNALILNNTVNLESALGRRI